MPIQFDWAFPEFDVAKSEDGLTDVVKVIHWQYKAVDGQYSAMAYGTVSLGPPDQKDFIPYSDLTKQWAIDAVSASVNVPALQASLTKAIEDQINPPIVPLPPPF